MTEDKKFKRRVRERMTKTGESYTAARTQVAPKRDRIQAARTRLSATDQLVSDTKIKEATGKKWDQWFSILDRWGADTKKHGEIARFVNEKHGVAGWWAQTVAVGYERARGMRLKHQRPDGFSVSVSKTIDAPAQVLFDAFVDGRRRKRWLTDSTMSLRTSQPGRTARFNWDDGSTRVNAYFEAKGKARATVTVAHEKLPDADEAETMKAFWRERLAELKQLQER